MSYPCRGVSCGIPRWMTLVLVAAGLYHLAFGLAVNLWPNAFFDFFGIDRPHPGILWRGTAFISSAMGLGFLIAARSPFRHWALILMGFLKFNLVVFAAVSGVIEGSCPVPVCLLVLADDLIWWFPFASILWAVAQAHAGRPPLRSEPLDLVEAGRQYQLSSGETLGEAASRQTVALVFLRHFGCTFTRQILRHLEALKKEADRHGARLVLVHMLEEGGEADYLGRRENVARIADPMCELYRAFGLGKGGFLELFGPRVWLPMAVALVRGCGVGHLAGDGLQMPGAFLFRDGRIVAAQRARSQADLPDLPRLFEGLPEPATPETVPA